MKMRDTYRAQLAAYFAGSLTQAEASALEAALGRDPQLAREAEELRPVANLIAAEAKSDSTPNFRLSSDRLAVIRAAARGNIVEFPLPATPAAEAPSSGRAVGLRRRLRRIAPASAAAAVIAIGVLAGMSSNRGEVRHDDSTIRVANQTSHAAVPSDEDETSIYPPAYGMDRPMLRHTTRSAYEDATVQFASLAPLTYGLPGPQSPFLSRRAPSIFLQ